MLRALVVLLALTGIAHADEITEGREAIKSAIERYDAVANHRNPFVRLWDLTGNAEWTNLQSSRTNLDVCAKDFNEAVAENSAYQIHAKLGDLKNCTTDLDRKIGEYATSSKGMTWKLGGALAAIVVFGIFVAIRRRRR